MSETHLQHRIIRHLWFYHAIPVENIKKPGTPDIAYVNGWIECKFLDAWPVKKDTIVRFRRFSGKQRIWLMRHIVMKGKAYVWLQVGTEFLIFDGHYAGTHLGKVTASELKRNSLYYDRKFPSHSDLQQIGLLSCPSKTV